jgi:hypothetical protein
MLLYCCASYTLSNSTPHPGPSSCAKACMRTAFSPSSLVFRWLSQQPQEMIDEIYSPSIGGRSPCCGVTVWGTSHPAQQHHFNTSAAFWESVGKVRRGVPWPLSTSRRIYGWLASEALRKMTMTVLPDHVSVNFLAVPQVQL